MRMRPNVCRERHTTALPLLTERNIVPRRCVSVRRQGWAYVRELGKTPVAVLARDKATAPF
jgi:hypothetical protein